MRIQRTIPPSAAPLKWTSLVHGLAGALFSRQHRKHLEESLKDHFGVRYVFLFSSGKAAFTVILRALHALEPGKRKVLIPAYTCFSVPSAIVKAGLDVSLCDIDNGTFDFNYRELAGAVDQDTLCVVSSHLFGMPADTDAALRLCSGKKIFVVEDAAQAMGAVHKGKLLGTSGDVGFFSLGRGKSVTCGSGGIIVTNNDGIAREIDRQYTDLETPGFGETLTDFFTAVLLQLFLRPSLYWFPAGLPFLRLGETIFDSSFPIKKMSGMKAGLMVRWRERLEKSNRIRSANASFFRSRIAAVVNEDRPSPCIRLPYLASDEQKKETIVSDQQAKKLGISRMYPTPIHEIEELKNTFAGMTFPRAKRCADRLVTLPTHELLLPADKERIFAYVTAQERSAARGETPGGQSACAQNARKQQVPEYFERGESRELRRS